ncbi:MAG: hypothetical protein V4717_01655 [Bacteroidota bacterium]
MTYKIVISTLAHSDEYEAYELYEQQRSGLGDEFLFELVSAYHKLSLHPDIMDLSMKKKSFVITSSIAFHF